MGDNDQRATVGGVSTTLYRKGQDPSNEPEDTCATAAGNSTSEDQSDRVWRNSTNQRSKLKQANTSQEDRFQVEEGIKTSVDELEGAHSD